ncbi:MAG: serine/threonine protein phosphatase [Oscillospiraceae bacterium]|nr:serine/threonine protein phosphatase [Oscillospiraceae bacterium]
MKLFEKKKTPQSLQVQTRSGLSHPFAALGGYVPLSRGELQLYRAIREALPIIDAAIGKLIRLSGGVRVTVPEGQEALNDFLRTVNTGRGQRGIQSFLDQYLDSMLVCGRGVGEMVLDRTGNVAALLCADPACIEIKEGESPLDLSLCARRADGRVEELPRQDLLLFTPFQPEPASPYGVSLLRSMPFLTDILLKIYHSIGLNWERLGNARFAVVYKPQAGDGPWARERGEEMARAWSQAMQAGKAGHLRDFVAVGDVDIKVIGADNQVLDSQVPVRQILEQLISKTGIPPFMLGLSWASTERMSAQQADLLTSEVTALRRSLTPVVERICEQWLRSGGLPGHPTVDWEDINLQDLVEEARAELYHEQAAALRRETETQ